MWFKIDSSGPEESRTPDLCNANAALWPTELRALVGDMGVEPIVSSSRTMRVAATLIPGYFFSSTVKY